MNYKSTLPINRRKGRVQSYQTVHGTSWASLSFADCYHLAPEPTVVANVRKWTRIGPTGERELIPVLKCPTPCVHSATSSFRTGEGRATNVKRRDLSTNNLKSSPAPDHHSPSQFFQASQARNPVLMGLSCFRPLQSKHRAT